MGDLRETNGGISEEGQLTSAWPLIGSESWAKGEKAAQIIISKVQPATHSEERRREVIDYIQRLIRGSLGLEVFPFGSVPLKTYLPDGDIDLTAFGGTSPEDMLAHDLFSVLQSEERNSSAEFIVKDIQLIRAEVKLVKCIVQNIVVDISFNQIGGLCTLCFLEQVDRLIGKDHLFKRSILLIKSWCYYESRILGAHHGLISTYALETLVLYIFHRFHPTLDAPLAVLYKFLDYFSKFDWDNYCISLTGPVWISSLPEIAADPVENGGGDLLLVDDFLRFCNDMFLVPSRASESRTFPQKHLNIVDPLKENNNLGRSVSKGNFFRIRSAFSYGARKLGNILEMSDDDDIGDELHKFFSNTLDMHGRGLRPDVTNGPDNVEKEDSNVNVPPDGNDPLLSDLVGDYERDFNCLQFGRWWYQYGTNGGPMFAIPPPPPPPRSPPPPPHFQLWDPPHHLKRNGFPPNPAFYPMNPPPHPPPPPPPPMVIPGVAPYALEEIPKPRGTGTYFPNTGRGGGGYRPWAGKGRNHHHHHHPPPPPTRSPRNNNGGRSNNHDRNMYELPPGPGPLPQLMPVPVPMPPPVPIMLPQHLDQVSFAPSPRGKIRQLAFQSEGGIVETESAAAQLQRHHQNAGPLSPTPGTPKSKSSSSRDQDRVAGKSSSAYRLRDEDEFPPLSV